MTTVQTALGPVATAQHFLPTAKRVDVLARLCAEGYAGKMVLSHDANCWTDMVSEDDKRRTRPLWHYNHIPDDILPALRKSGVSEDQIEQMLVENPGRSSRRRRRRGVTPVIHRRASILVRTPSWARLGDRQQDWASDQSPSVRIRASAFDVRTTPGRIR
jgi:Phosphotriesterase family